MLICPLLIQHSSFTAQFIRVTVFISFEALTSCTFAWRFTVWVCVCYVNRLSLNLVNSVIHQKFDWNSQFRPTTQLKWNRDFPEFTCHLIPVKNVWTPEGKKREKSCTPAVASCLLPMRRISTRAACSLAHLVLQLNFGVRQDQIFLWQLKARQSRSVA